MIKAVLDTNVVIAAHLSNNPGSPTREIIDRWRAEEFIQVYSAETLTELTEKLWEKGVALDLIEKYTADLVRLGKFVRLDPKDIKRVILDDPDDDVVIACAVKGGADYLVTYDPHFDVLGGEYKGVRIVNALEFLEALRRGGK